MFPESTLCQYLSRPSDAQSTYSEIVSFLLLCKFQCSKNKISKDFDDKNIRYIDFFLKNNIVILWWTFHAFIEQQHSHVPTVTTFASKMCRSLTEKIKLRARNHVENLQLFHERKKLDAKHFQYYDRSNIQKSFSLFQ